MKNFTWRKTIVGSMFLMLLTGSGLFAGDSKTYRNDSRRTGTTSEVVPPGMLNPVDFDGDGNGDSIQVSGKILARPVVSNHRLYVGTLRGELQCISMDTGNVLWKRRLSGGVLSPPMIHKGILYAGTKSGNFYAIHTCGTHLDGSSRAGDVKWTRKLKGQIVSAPVHATDNSGNDRIVVAGGRTMYALKPGSGNTVWTYRHNQLINSSPSIAGNQVVFGSGNGKLISVHLPDGSENWVNSTEGNIFKSSVSVASTGELYFVPGGAQNHLLQIDSNNGTVLSNSGSLWSNPHSLVACGSPAVMGGRVYITVQREKTYKVVYETYAFDSTNQDWKKTSSAFKKSKLARTGFAPAPVVDGNHEHLYTAMKDQLEVRNPQDGTLLSEWILPSGNPGNKQTISVSPVISNGRIVVCTYGGSIYILQSGNNAPPAPDLVAPTADASMNSTDVLLDWESVTDPDGDSLSYRVEGSWEHSCVGKKVNFSTSLSGHEKEYTDLFSQGMHVRWRVKAVDSNGASSPWTEGHFWIKKDVTAPNPPRNFNALSRENGLYLTWDSSTSEDVSGYRVSHRRSSNRDWTHTYFGLVDEGEVDGLENDVTYELKIVAIDDYQNISDAVLTMGTPRDGIVFNDIAYKNIQKAIDAAEQAGGGVVHLGAEEFQPGSPLDIPAGVSLRGEGPGMTILKGASGQPVMNIETDRARDENVIDGMTVTGSQSSSGLVVTGDGAVKITHILFVDLGGDGLIIGSDVKGTVVNDSFLQLLGDAIESQSSNLKVENILFADNSGYAIRNLASNSIEVDYFNAYGNNGPNRAYFDPAQHFKNVTVGNNYLSKSIQFRDPDGGDYRVESGSPIIDQGNPDHAYSREPDPNGGRVNMGAYGGSRWAARTGLNHNPEPSKNQTYSATVTLKGVQRKVQYSAKTYQETVELSWKVPFHKDQLTDRADYFTFEILYRRSNTSEWNSRSVDRAEITEDGENSNIFYATGETRLNNLENRKKYETVLKVYYSTGGTPRVVDPVAMTVVPGIPADGGSSSSGCFVATAAWASPAMPAVLDYRMIRDRFLLEFGFGTVGVQTYYRVSPPAAKTLEHSTLMKRFTRSILK